MSSGDLMVLLALTVAVGALAVVAREVRRAAAELHAVRRAELRHRATHGELHRIMQVRRTASGVGRGIGSLSRRRGAATAVAGVDVLPPGLTPGPETSASGSDLPGPPTPPDVRPG